LAELSAAGKASILIPYPYAAENHQEYNGRVFEDQGAAYMILDKELECPILWETVRRTLSNVFKLEEMSVRSKGMFSPGALDRIINLCLQTAWAVM
jgi:UDP-N-acetylglucosamine--N-acetylmuramyl-(pentapeptide) pyrophosphoryl-undecaprenol N-acetylglucosamine transferase